MTSDQKRRGKNPDFPHNKGNISAKDFLEKHALRIKPLLSEDRSLSFDQYIRLLEEELVRIKGIQKIPLENRAIPLEENLFRKEFLFKTFHEMRNPLHAIMGYASLVLRKTRELIPPNHQENLEKVIQSADHLKELVDKMVAYYREK